jgi:hypothetical protein
MAITLIGAPSATHYDPITAGDGNVLVNPGFEDGDFTWHYPNHYVAADWKRWWIHGTDVPEYTDTGWGRTPYEGSHAQIYHSHQNYTAGIYQVVNNVTACRPYQLSMYTKTHSGYAYTVPHSRIGLDPYGTKIDRAVENSLPESIVWSNEQTQLTIWEEFAVTVEPLGDKLTAILYAAPEPSPSFDETYWDSGSLLPVTYENGRLPDSTGTSDFINNISVVTGTESVTISWHTTEPPAATQVWYNVLTPSTPITSTDILTYATYLPLISRSEEPLDRTTGISFMRATEHQSLINGLSSGQVINFVIVARRLNSNICETVQSERWTVKTEANIP